MAIALRDKPASAIPVGETMATDISFVDPDDDIDDALKLMSARQIRRLLVVDSDGRLSGILSTSDIVRHSDKGKGKKHISNKDTMKMLHAVAKPHSTSSAEVTIEPDVETVPEPAPAETAAPL
jgi:signal-transduction protein with cAMP-binding, CBS, and nucleotidyltransferase domain